MIPEKKHFVCKKQGTIFLLENMLLEDMERDAVVGLNPAGMKPREGTLDYSMLETQRDSKGQLWIYQMDP